MEVNAMMWRYGWTPSWQQAIRGFNGPVGFNGGRRVPLDVRADDEAFVITAELPGLTPDDVKIDILDDVVTLSGQIEVEENGHGEALLREIPDLGSFSRRLRLPEPVDAEQAEASMENGLLTLRIPKSEAARPKSIQITAK
jgi:HSP20 family protein